MKLHISQHYNWCSSLPGKVNDMVCACKVLDLDVAIMKFIHDQDDENHARWLEA